MLLCKRLSTHTAKQDIFNLTYTWLQKALAGNNVLVSAQIVQNQWLGNVLFYRTAQ
jgi:hypothetical protein